MSSEQNKGRRPDCHCHYYHHVAEKDKTATIIALHDRINLSQFVLFCSTDDEVKRVAAQLRRQVFLVSTFYGSRSLGEWENTLKEFVKGSAPVLVTTDTYADHFGINKCRLVFNWDLPEPSVYLKRSGAIMDLGFMISFVPEGQHVRLEDYAAVDLEKLPKATFSPLVRPPIYQKIEAKAGLTRVFDV